MNLSELRVGVVPGSGVVTNAGAAILLAFPEGDAQNEVLDELLSLVDAVVAEEPAAPGRKLARRIAGVLSAAEPDDVPSFGLVAAADRGLAVLLQGAVDVELGGAEHLSGQDVSTWLDRIVGGDVGELAMHGSARSGHADPRSDLRAGTVPADGVVLSRRAASAAAPAEARQPRKEAASKAAPQPVADEIVEEPTIVDAKPVAPPPPPPEAEPETPPAEFVSVSLAEPVPAEELQPLPIAGAPSAEPTAAEPPTGVEVRGILCSRQHFNDPNALFCSSCGISMVQQTHNLVKGIRPPLGILVLDDGSAFALDGDYVIGREPDGHPDVQSREARPLTVTDQDATTSRSHARIHLHEWDVQVIDLASANGSYIAPPGATEWTRLTPHTPAPIVPGSRVHIGGRNFVYESHHKT